MSCKVEKDILFYALEYAMGRRTFAPTTVMKAITDNLKLFENWEIEQIIHRIYSHEQLHGDLGSDSDKADWYEFINFLNRQLCYRQTIDDIVQKGIKR